MITTFFIWTVIFYLVLRLKKERFNQNRIPKTIWCFWDSDILPNIVKICYDSILRNHPDYEVRLLRPADIPQEIKNMKHGKDSVQRLSDLLRLWYLKEYGGVWIDISTYFNKPIVLNNNYEFTLLKKFILHRFFKL